MLDQDSDPSNDTRRRKRAQDARDNEGGSSQVDRNIEVISKNDEAPMPKMGEAEMGALHIRVIALENLVIALLADASDRQLELSRNMARYIAPRQGFTHHPLTTHAAAHMTHLVERSARFGSGELPQADDIK